MFCDKDSMKTFSEATWLFSLILNIIILIQTNTVICSRPIRRYVTLIVAVYGGAYGEREVCTGRWWGSLRKRDHWGDPDVDGKIILRWISGSWRGLWGLDGFGSG
jgi:hypothetical protein